MLYRQYMLLQDGRNAHVQLYSQGCDALAAGYARAAAHETTSSVHLWGESFLEKL